MPQKKCQSFDRFFLALQTLTAQFHVATQALVKNVIPDHLGIDDAVDYQIIEICERSRA